MAKQMNQATGRSKIRLLYIDGDFTPGDLQQITQAITGALRPATIVVKPQIQSQYPAEEGGPAETPEANEPRTDETAAPENGETNGDVEAPRGPARVRKFASPKVVNSLDMKSGGKPFAEFAIEKGNPVKHNTRFLVSAFWLKEYAQLDSVSLDHVYTCYKSAGWAFDVRGDPQQPFRRLARSGFGEAKEGQFTINHIGESEVDKMIASASK